MLLGVGLTVDTAEDGVGAVERVQAGAYDLILMDMQMPRLDGPAASRAIRALPGWAGRPILALTANAFGEDREACLAAGMNDVITKPVLPETLYTALLQWLPAQRYAPSSPGEWREPPPVVRNTPGEIADVAAALDRLACLDGFDMVSCMAPMRA
jgi:CheY-like chemotaxis protein